jgi:hypothetical protein
MASVIWTGDIENVTYRVVDRTGVVTPRLVVELQGQPDAMGVVGWNRFDPIPTAVFSAMLVAAGVVT